MNFSSAFLTLMISLISLESFALFERPDRHCFLYRKGPKHGDVAVINPGPLAISRGPSYRFSLNLNNRYYDSETEALAALAQLTEEGKCEPNPNPPHCMIEKYDRRKVTVSIDDYRKFGLYSNEQGTHFVKMLIQAGQCHP